MEYLSAVGSALWTTCAVCTIISVATYALPQLLVWALGPQDLKKRYGADCKWALVTGGSSGIGYAIVEMLAKQGLNVVVVGLPDKTLDESMEKLPKAWPGVEFRKLGVDLADPKCVDILGDATKSLDISLVFSNAGYIRTSFLTSVPVGAAVHNHHVNATSSLQVAHLYTSRMQAKGLRGAVCFTSSPAGVMASPFAAVYGATKAFVTEFAMSLAPEVREDGIDVCVLHPSPMATAFYSGAHSIDSVNFFKNTAVGPAAAANALCASIGRVVVCEQGYYPVCVRMLTKVLDSYCLTDIITRIIMYLPDYKLMKEEDAKRAAAAATATAAAKK